MVKTLQLVDFGDMHPREEVLWFAAKMEKELRENDHKGGWEDCTYEYLLKRLRDEYAELKHKLDRLQYPVIPAMTQNDYIELRKQIVSEAADVANFSMMIASLAKGRGVE